MKRKLNVLNDMFGYKNSNRESIGSSQYSVIYSANISTKLLWHLNFLEAATISLCVFYRADKLGGEAEIVCLRDRTKDGQREVGHSIVFKVSLPSISELTGPCYPTINRIASETY